MSTRRGLQRPEIEGLARDAAIRITGLASDRVFFSDQASDAPAPQRPFVSMRLLPPAAETREGETATVAGLEYWRATIPAPASGPYSLTVDGVTYTIAAVGTSAPLTRNALLALMGAMPHATAASAGSASIDIESSTPGLRLLCSSARITLDRLRGNHIRVTSRPVECILQCLCWGSYSRHPSASTSGRDLAERLAAGMIDAAETAEMRDANHHILRYRITDMERIAGGESEQIGVVDFVLGTTICHVSFFDNVTEATLQMEAT